MSGKEVLEYFCNLRDEMREKEERIEKEILYNKDLQSLNSKYGKYTMGIEENVKELSVKKNMVSEFADELTELLDEIEKDM